MTGCLCVCVRARHVCVGVCVIVLLMFSLSDSLFCYILFLNREGLTMKISALDLQTEQGLYLCLHKYSRATRTVRLSVFCRSLAVNFVFVTVPVKWLCESCTTAFKLNLCIPLKVQRLQRTCMFANKIQYHHQNTMMCLHLCREFSIYLSFLKV